MFNRQIFSDHETNGERNKIIRLNYNLYVYPMLLYEIARKRGERKKNSFCIFLHHFRGFGLGYYYT